MGDLEIFSFDKEGNIKIDYIENLKFNSFYNVEKLNNLFKNLDTISFFELLTESEDLIIRGYEKSIISEKINTFLALPFFLSLMTILAAVFTINKKKFK